MLYKEHINSLQNTCSCGKWTFFPLSDLVALEQSEGLSVAHGHWILLTVLAEDFAVEVADDQMDDLKKTVEPAIVGNNFSYHN